MSNEVFAYVWSYRVSSDETEEFIRLYGPDGAWVRLFRQGQGYLGTHLYRDRNDEGRFLTIDRWESEGSFASFRREFDAEFERLDREGEDLTQEEVSLGEFRLMDGGD